MNRRFTGVIFCFISAFLFSARYITAAIFANGIASWNKELFESMLQYTGNALLVVSIISLAVGAAYLIAGEFEASKNK